jgi:RNase P/RNase MRP subunit p29
MSPKNILVLTSISIFILVGCGGGGTSTPTVASQELLDPNAAASNEFGTTTVILANGNIVVASPNDDTVATNAGSVHLYNPFTKTVIASFYGDTAYDKLGSSSVTALGNNNFVIASSTDDVNSVTDAGSVMLINGATGAQIKTIAGDTAIDSLGSSSITALGNNNFVIASRFDDVNSVVNAGSVMLVNGTTGAQINTIAGDTAQDFLGYSGVTALGNNNFVIASRADDVNSVVNAGSVMLINGATGAQINTIEGDTENDYLGHTSVTALGNNNFVIASLYDDVNSVVNAGSVMLINGVTGAQINTIAGDTAHDKLGDTSVTALGNNNFVIASGRDDVNSVVNAGSVMLINGATGAQIDTIAGNTADDKLGYDGVTALGNNNFVIASRNDDVNSVVNAGSVMLINGTTGAQINTIAGDTAHDQFGFNGVTALGNNNFVIASYWDDVNSVVNAGSVMLINGATGAQINTIEGDTLYDALGFNGVTALGNNNFVIASHLDDVNSVTDAGSVRLINGATGAQIGAYFGGDTANDQLGSSSITALGNNNFVIASRYDDVNGVSDAGSIIQVDTTGTQVSIITGAVTNDMSNISVTNASTHNFYVVSLRGFDNNSMTDSGFATVVAY